MMLEKLQAVILNSERILFMFCRKCGAQIPFEESEICVTCGVRIVKKVENHFTHWIPLLINFVILITFGALGGDYPREMNIWDYISIPISIGTLVVAIIFIPSKRSVLRISSIVFSSILTVATISWVFL